MSEVSDPNEQPRGRIHGLDIARGLACWSMPIYHGVYNAWALGLIDTKPTTLLGWTLYQRLGMSTFILVSGISVALVGQSAVRRGAWPQRWWRRLGILVLVALAISVGTAMVSDRWVRFGIIHFFVVASMLAPLLVRLRWWNAVIGLPIACFGWWQYGPGMWPIAVLYPTGLMSGRPSSMDYVPLIPWLGVFMVGIALGSLIRRPRQSSPPPDWARPIIWTGRHSLWFYLAHQPVVFALLWLVARGIDGGAM